MKFNKILDRHYNHTVVILPRYHKGKAFAVPGLYCESCAKLIKWLDRKTANNLIEYGVEQLAMIPGEEKSLNQEIIKQKLRTSKNLRDSLL